MDNKPAIQVLPDRTIYRASALGECIKALAARRMGYEPFSFTEDELTRFKEGDLHEDAILSELPYVLDRQRELVLQLTSSLSVVGHIDGVQTEYGKRKLLEIKTTNKEGFKEIVEKGWETPGFVQKYKWQISCYMIALDLECDLIFKDKESGKLWTLSAEIPPYSIEQIRARVLRVEAIARSGSLPKLCEPGVNQWFCKFPFLHEHDPVTVLDDKELGELAHQYDNAVIDVRTAEERKKSLRKALKNGMGDHKKVAIDDARVTFYNTPKISYDHKAMASDGIDIAKYKVVKDVEYLKVKIKEKDEQETGADRKE